MPSVSACIPQVGKDLVSYQGREILDKLGHDAVRHLVSGILCGRNIRSMTETLTRKRLGLSNAALLVTFIKASASIPGFTDDMARLIGEEIRRRDIDKDERQFLQWMIGLTGKSVQNVLRSSDDALEPYLNEVDSALRDSASQAAIEFGRLGGDVSVGDLRMPLTWPVLSRLFMAIGAQTLAIRGSEKSMYGKLFERLVLGALLSMLGFTFAETPAAASSERIFWLSHRSEKRESDATLLYGDGLGVRFDIGFIGPGNPEISLDKVSRFERVMEHRGERHTMTTVVIVDRIGKGSRIADLANAIDGHIVQMSMSLWVLDVARILAERIGFEHELLQMRPHEALDFVSHSAREIDLRPFVEEAAGTEASRDA